MVFFHNYSFVFLHEDDNVPISSLTLREKDSMQSSVIWFFSHQNPGTPKKQKFCFTFWCSNSYFSINTGFISSSEVSIQNFTAAEESLIEKLSIMFLESNLDSPNLPEISYQKCFVSIIEMVFLQNNRFDLLHERQN